VPLPSGGGFGGGLRLPLGGNGARKLPSKRNRKIEVKGSEKKGGSAQNGGTYKVSSRGTSPPVIGRRGGTKRKAGRRRSGPEGVKSSYMTGSRQILGEGLGGSVATEEEGLGQGRKNPLINEIC